MRSPGRAIRPGLLTSMWASQPGRARSSRRAGSRPWPPRPRPPRQGRRTCAVGPAGKFSPPYDAQMSVEPLPVDVPPAWHAAVYADNTFVSSESEHDLTLDLSQLVPGPDHRTVAVGVAR